MATAQSSGRLPRSLDLTSLMLAGYNAGPAAVLAAGKIPSIAETQTYVRTILAAAPQFAGATDDRATGSFAAREIAAAEKYLGIPYAWDGGNYLGPTRGLCVGGAAANDCNKVGFDCSGLVLYAVYVASNSKLRLPHSADEQTRGGTPVPITQLRPGDLISFTDRGASIAHHVGIYLGNDELLNAPESNAVVRVDSLASPYYRGQKWRAVRYG
jgi:cell wall-associated NlpC family hydrolase